MGRDSWHNQTLTKLNKLEDTLDKQTQKIMKVNLLRCIINRKGTFIKENCDECLENTDYVDKMLAILEQLDEPIKKIPSEYKVLLNNLLEHLSSKHKLTLRFEYTLLICKGTALAGSLISLFLLDGINMLLGIGGSLFIGLLIGSFIDYRKKRKDLIV